MQRLMWALYVEHEWIPGADRLLEPAGAQLHGPALHQYNAARMAANRLMGRLFPDDESVEVTADVG